MTVVYRRRAAVLALCVAVARLDTVAIVAQTATGATPETADDRLEPDRPDVTNGTHIVDVGLLQLEVGGIWTEARTAVHSLGTPLTVRVGLTDWFEARLSGDGFLAVSDPSGYQSGFGNVQLGAKLRLWADPGGVPVLSILPAVNLPVASESKGLGSGQSDFTIAVLTGADVFAHAHVDVNYGIGRIGAGTGLPRFTQHLASASASAEVPGPVTPYVEGFWFSRQEADGRAVVAVDGGAIYVINPRLAVDAGVQVGLTAAAQPLAAFAGLSLVVGDILGDHGVHARQREVARRRAARAATGRR
jgi:hypothetical protein